ncbi:hypothetical protein [Intestinibacillus massiliensis]|uniref:hypothetical protein n=1 Tax=Intestinibacillus massiliensis TaxID=1871029 RepID=UPI000B355617|nr:hypothetical protein [Intestinibacillus massiliensis]
MKQVFYILLAGMLAFPLSGCSSSAAASDMESTTPPQAVNDGASAPQEDPVSTRIAEAYRVSIESEEQQLYQLSERIDTLPVQPRPATESLKKDYRAYLDSLQGIHDQLSAFDTQAGDDLSAGNLVQEDYEAIVFQLDQLTGRVQGLRDTLCVVYGLSEENVEPAA